MTIAIDSVCTHDDLVNELHSPEALNELLPRSANGSSAGVRTKILGRVLSALKRRMPPITESDLNDPTELRDAVLYGTLEDLHMAGLTTSAEGDVHWAKYKIYRDKFSEEISGMTLTVCGGSTAGPMSFSLERR